MKEPRLAYLFHAYFNKSETPAERDELMELLAEAEHDEQTKKLLTEAWQQLTGQSRSFSDDQGEEMLAGILHKARNRSIAEMEPDKRSFGWFRIAAAAAILFLVITGISFWVQTKQPVPKITQSANLHKTDHNTIVPGGNKALLTLADGSHISLDSTRGGTLAMQGNAKITNLHTAVLAYNTLNGNSRELVHNTLSTPVGGQYQLVLSDGTKVWLNASSSIYFPVTFTGNERNVTITGEVYFEVAKNAAMPFTVNVKDVTVQVLGTHFNIMAYNNESSVNTTLLEGSVKISQGSSSSMLVPGQESRVSKTGDMKVVVADMEEVIAWKNGWFQFEAWGIEKVMRQISRWYDVEIEYEGVIPHGHFSGMVSRENNISQVLKILQAGGVGFKIQGRKVILYTDKFYAQ